MSDTQTDPYTVTTDARGGGVQTHKVLSASYHRNGVGGAGFYVGIVETTWEGEEPVKFLVTIFPDYDHDDEGVAGEQVAVVALDEVAKGNVFMFPAFDPVTFAKIDGSGGNAWRGADQWGECLPAMRKWAEDSSKAARISYK